MFSLFVDYNTYGTPSPPGLFFREGAFYTGEEEVHVGEPFDVWLLSSWKSEFAVGIFNGGVKDDKVSVFNFVHNGQSFFLQGFRHGRAKSGELYIATLSTAYGESVFPCTINN